MSASDKKKIRKVQSAALLTEKQMQEKAEAKKLRNQTIGFVVAMILIVCVVLTVLAVRTVNNSGIIQRNTVAITLDGKEISSADLNYYYVDAINDFYNQQYESFQDSTDDYLKAMGLDTTKPLSEQIFDEEAEEPITWAQYFVDIAVEQAKSDYALYDMAKADSEFALPEEEQENLDNAVNNIETYAKLFGYSSGNQYVRAMYGYGSNVDNYSDYLEREAYATAYYNAHEDALIYEDAAIREYEADKKVEYNSYSYTSAYLSYTYFLQGGTKDEDGKITYSEEDNNTARAAMKAAAEDLAKATSVEELKTKVDALKLTEGSTIKVDEKKNTLYSSVDHVIRDWLTSADRKAGDISAIANETTTEGEDPVTNGYYVVIFQGVSDNVVPMGNVRHLLVKFDAEDEENVSDAEKAAAKEKADGYLKTWKEGDATEESFIELVKEHSDDSSAESGGLFENIHPNSSYVEPFLNWSIAPERKAGDAEVIETEFGYHVMYFVKAGELTYRDYMLTNNMRTEDQEEWFNGIVEAVEVKEVNISKLDLDKVISAG